MHVFHFHERHKRAGAGEIVQLVKKALRWILSRHDQHRAPVVPGLGDGDKADPWCLMAGKLQTSNRPWL